MINPKLMTSNDTQILDRKLRDYGNQDDFVAPRELTVTITLNEYRHLVMVKGVYEKTIEYLRNKNYDLEQKVQTLNHKVCNDTDANVRSADET